jgi:hypothetical protein
MSNLEGTESEERLQYLQVRRVCAGRAETNMLGHSDAGAPTDRSESGILEATFISRTGEQLLADCNPLRNNLQVHELLLV